MPQSQVLKSLLNPQVPHNIRLMAARGLAPLPPSELIQVLVFLTADAEPEIATQAQLTIRGLSEDEIRARLADRNCSSEVLEYFASANQSESVLEALILNSATPNRAIEALALTVSGRLLERILDNRVRLLNAPGILDNIKRNTCASPEVQRLVQEIETEFFGNKKRNYALAETEEKKAPSSDDAVYLQPETVPDDLSLESLPLDPEEREAALTTRIARMSVRQKIQHALLGTREARSILIRDANKEVARSVLQSPKLSENEIETYASMRNVSEDILREIGNSRDWTRGYGVVHNLIKNPKTPPMVSQRLLFRLQSKDLSLLARDRGIPEAVRQGAQRALKQRSNSH